MKTARYYKKGLFVSYFNSHNTEVSVNCSGIKRAREIVKKSGVIQDLIIVK